jgi:hypothetical protein
VNRIKAWIKKLATVNPGLKFLALAMAIFTFHSIRGVTSDEAVMIVPVEVQTDETVMVVEQDILSASVTFRGSAEDIRKAQTQKAKVIVKLRDLESTVIPIRHRDIEDLSGVRIVKIEPDRVVVAAQAVSDAEKEPDPSKPLPPHREPPAREPDSGERDDFTPAPPAAGDPTASPPTTESNRLAIPPEGATAPAAPQGQGQDLP